jgi:phospholipase/lecithinase/hemolysin
MPFPRLRRALLTAACALPIVLAACGGGDIVSELQPSRLVVFGDAFSDIGQRGVRYTVNGVGGNWTEQFASRYGLSLTPSASGGTSYATGSARVTAKPDASGDASTATVAEQVSTFLGSRGIAENDLIIVSGGIADILAESAALRAGSQSAAQTRANVEQAGRALGDQVQRIVDAGATHVMVVGPYNLGRSPWAVAQQGGEGATCQDPSENPEDASPACLSSAFNQALLVRIVRLGANVRFVDAALHFNQVTSTPTAFSFDDAVHLACNSVDPGPGIGVGAGQVNSALCTTSTLTGVNIDRTVFADPIYLTPAANASFGNYAFDRIRENF